MAITTISKEAPIYGNGKQLGKDYYEAFEGVKMFFYDEDSIKEEFGNYGLTEVSAIMEPHKNMDNKLPFKFTVAMYQKKQ